MEQTTALQTKGEEYSLAAPIEFDGPSGFEGVTQECTVLPFLKVAQSSTNEAKKGDPKQIPGLELGHFFCPATRKVYGDSINLVILKFYRQYVIYESRDAASKFMGTMAPEDFAKIEKQCVREKSYHLDAEGHRYVDTRNFIVLAAGRWEDGPMLYSMASTGIGPSRKLLTQAQNVRDPNGKLAPIWSSVWKLTTGYQSNDAGQSYYQVAGIDRLGYVPKERAKMIVDAFLDAQGMATSALSEAVAKQHDLEETVPAPEASHVTVRPTPTPAKAGKDDEQMF